MRRIRRHRIRLLLPLLLGVSLLLSGCSSSVSIEIGAIRVVVTTVGNDFDPDGYTIQVAGNEESQSQPVEVNGEVLFAVRVGSYTVTVTDKAPNCVTDINPQVVNVSVGQTSRLVFNNLCG